MASLFTTLAVALLATGLLPTLGNANSIERRDTAIFVDHDEFFHRYRFDPEWMCKNLFRREIGCQVATDNSTWMMLTFSDESSSWPAEYVWEEDDTTTAKCLINLHYVQDTKCISVRGSECEANAGTSKILNSRYQYGRITATDSIAMQAASEALIGNKVQSNPDISYTPAGVHFGHINRALIPMNSEFYLQERLGIFFGGDEQCDD